MSDLNNRFDFHPAGTADRAAAHDSIREGCKALAEFIDGRVPNGREKAHAITKIEEAMFWANAGIARKAA